MATIDNRGFVDDGTAGLTIAGGITANSVSQATVTLTATGLVTIPGAGYYQVAASGSGGVGSFTGSMPSAAANPGGQFFIVDTLVTNPYLLSGSAVSGQPMFVVNSTVLPATASKGSALVAAKGASVHCVSDGYRWLVIGGSGSLTLTA